MARRPIAAVATDFAEVIAFLTERGIVPEGPDAEYIRVARQIHDATYSLILWRFRLTVPDHGRVFLEEIASDALQILPQVLMGYGKTAKLLIRGVTENTLRHLYFLDHPIEFARMNRERKWFMTIDALIDYAKNHPVFFGVERKFDALNQLSTLYSDLSGGIHGRTVQDLEMRRALRRIVYDQQAAAGEASFIRRTAEACNFLIAMLHRDKVAAFHGDDRRIILRSMPQRARQVWREHD